MTKFGGGVDEFQLDGLFGLARCVHQQRLPGNAVTKLIRNDLNLPQKRNTTVAPINSVKHVKKYTMHTFLRVRTRFFAPTTQPFTIRKSLFTSP